MQLLGDGQQQAFSSTYVILPLSRRLATSYSDRPLLFGDPCCLACSIKNVPARASQTVPGGAMKLTSIDLKHGKGINDHARPLWLQTALLKCDSLASSLARYCGDILSCYTNVMLVSPNIVSSRISMPIRQGQLLKARYQLVSAPLV